MKTPTLWQKLVSGFKKPTRKRPKETGIRQPDKVFIPERYKDLSTKQITKIPRTAKHYPRIPKGCKHYYFNEEGEFRMKHAYGFYIEIIALNDKNAIRKFKNKQAEYFKTETPRMKRTKFSNKSQPNETR